MTAKILALLWMALSAIALTLALLDLAQHDYQNAIIMAVLSLHFRLLYIEILVRESK